MSNTKTKTKAKAKKKTGSTSITTTFYKTIDDGMSTVEEIHKSIAALPLDVLSVVTPLEGAVNEIRDVQDHALTSIYGLIREVNAQAGKMTKDILTGR